VISRIAVTTRFIHMIHAVKTTKIYCRPGCSARPKPENVTIYPSRAAAERDGFRACKRCRPELGEWLRFATARTRLGTVLVAAGEGGVRAVLLGDSAASAERELRESHPDAFITRDRELRALATGILDSPTADLDMRGTAFQLEVWRKLLEIPRGETRTYAQLAAELGRPRAVRAVGRACGSNRLGILVPCHRVVGADGSLTGYRWGVERKRLLLEAEREHLGRGRGERGAHLRLVGEAAA
jgi:AraC family transcriptional regulator, regulatory protein of adaptative response / methylated-DNA-[protein]-cysteine methyltransferase